MLVRPRAVTRVIAAYLRDAFIGQYGLHVDSSRLIYSGMICDTLGRSAWCRGPEEEEGVVEDENTHLSRY